MCRDGAVALVACSLVIAPLALSTPILADEPVAEVQGNALAEYAIYLGVGPVVGLGKVVQVNSEGRVLATVALTATPYGVASHQEQLYAALPRANNVVRIDKSGEVTTWVEDPRLSHPIDVAVQPINGHLFITDNGSDAVGRVTPDGEVAIQPLAPSPRHWQNANVSVTVAGKVVLASSDPSGTFLFNWGDALETPILAGADNGVAADPTSNQWAAFDAQQTLQIFDGQLPVTSLPVAASPYRGGLMAYSPGGELIIVQTSPGGPQVVQVDPANKAFRPLFIWKGDRLVDLAIGPPLDWSDSANNK
jgi:DNA-binding beta-propeller fold protein YncE